ncbi:PREDICTED: transferrin-like [Polistes dominula]|uniref:Transferrin-like n=1 Tax=Polistes dominula TaxID=743375 RepID=A0ABM1I1U4_POLDO|nr:PREDICTED: transferrin-like [Polistes dominula]
MKSAYLLFLIISFVTCTYTRKYKLCTTTHTISEACQSIERGDSEVECLHVSDSAECALRLASGDADFGLFDTDALLLSYQFYHTEIVPIFELRHKDKTQQSFAFKSVAIVSSNFSIKSEDKFENLKNAGLCHPGFSEDQWWNDFILKYFEKKLYVPECRENLTSIENELENIRSFFGKACRPGKWVADPNLSTNLKKKYPELCELCDNTITCNYKNGEKHGHIGALDCLTSGRGNVAYVALEYVHQYFNKENEKSQYQFLCSDGTLQNLNNSNPCAWIKQPWGAIVARKELVNELTGKLNKWLKNPATYAAETWSQALIKVIQEDSIVTNLTKPTSLYNYLVEGRKEVDLSEVRTTCEKHAIRWCTINPLEKTKCEWIAKQAIALGIEPKIVCLQANSTFQCMRDIADLKADITTADSNYGYLARQLYNLGPILYAETDKKIKEDSMIMAVLRKSEGGNYPIKSFNQLKGRRACFPEYGGLAWLSLIKIARVNHIISSVSCKYPGLLNNLLAGACTPGINDDNHGSNTVSKNIAKKLCSVCPKINDTTDCTASNENRFYGDKGALTCLMEGYGDIAFVEIGNIKKEKSDVDQYHIFCRNGSLATTSGLNISKPELCALSTTINSEVIARRNDTEIQRLNSILVLLKLEDWLKYRSSSWRVLHIYGKFDNTDDLLFKSSTFGLVPTTSTIESVLAYKELFDHVDECSSAGLLIVSNVTLFSLVLISIYSMI